MYIDTDKWNDIITETKAGIDKWNARAHERNLGDTFCLSTEKTDRYEVLLTVHNTGGDFAGFDFACERLTNT